MCVEQLVICVLHADMLVRQTLVDFLADLGHLAVAVRSDAELLAALQSGARRVDLALVQAGLWQASRADFLSQMHQQAPRTAFLLITNSGSMPPADQARERGVIAYLREPIRLCELELLLDRPEERRRHDVLAADTPCAGVAPWNALHPAF